MRRLVCAFVDRKPLKTGFLASRPFCIGFFQSDEHAMILGIISAVGCAISMCALILTIIFHLLVWRYVEPIFKCLIQTTASHTNAPMQLLRV